MYLRVKLPDYIECGIRAGRLQMSWLELQTSSLHAHSNIIGMEPFQLMYVLY